ncbi:hypothetical protein LPJ61_001993 [Coemansia biformis]|uniref:BZIP domain-containing protein n=1 Tax=Coemansia biformis TaxID=1286918 RepID=A0A9W7YGN3_9FUNG|nr:hypothetical protein LPJ61_001993 [Coemansia biformis]
MDKLFSILGAAAVPPLLLATHDDGSAYAFPPIADGYEAWAYPETQQAVFDDWVAAAAPPPTAVMSPLALSPALSSPSSSGMSTHSSPLLASDLALSLVSSLQPPAPLSVVDYAALFPDLAASLTSALASPIEACQPYAMSPVAGPAPGAGLAAGLAGMLEPMSPAALLPDAMGTQSPAAETDAEAGADEQRKRRDREFLASLPPQLALKRRRTSNNKQKEKILAELLQPAEAIDPAPAAADAQRPAAAKCAPDADADAAAADDSACDGDGDGDTVDAAALKRKKNTDAARRSRMRKILRIETLEHRVSELEDDNARLAQLVARLEAEKAAMTRALI